MKLPTTWISGPPLMLMRFEITSEDAMIEDDDTQPFQIHHDFVEDMRARATALEARLVEDTGDPRPSEDILARPSEEALKSLLEIKDLFSRVASLEATVATTKRLVEDMGGEREVELSLQCRGRSPAAPTGIDPVEDLLANIAALEGEVAMLRRLRHE